jgi:hypothetical protein
MAAQNKRQMQLIFGLIVVAVVLAAGIVIYATRSTPTTTAANNNTTTPSTSSTNPVATAPFDAETATKVPAGQTPEQFVEGYYKAVVAGDFANAYKLLPQTKKQAQSEAEFITQLKGYGITSFKMDPANKNGTSMTITVEETTASYGGGFATVWTFIQQSGTWLLKSKAMPGMQQ